MIVFWCSPPALTTTTHLAADPGDVDVLLALLDERAPELSDDLAASSPVKEDIPIAFQELRPTVFVPGPGRGA